MLKHSLYKDFLDVINQQGWNTDLDSILSTGRVLEQAKEELTNGAWKLLVKELCFTQRTVNRLRAVSRDKKISKKKHRKHLPHKLGHLDIIRQMTDNQLSDGIKRKVIQPEATREDLDGWKKGTKVKAKKTSVKTKKMFTVSIHADEDDIERIENIHSFIIWAVDELQEKQEIGTVVLEDHGYLEKITEKLQKQNIAEVQKDMRDACTTAKKVIRAHCADQKRNMSTQQRQSKDRRYQCYEEEFQKFPAENSGELEERLDWCLEDLGYDFTVQDLMTNPEIGTRVVKRFNRK